MRPAADVYWSEQYCVRRLVDGLNGMVETVAGNCNQSGFEDGPALGGALLNGAAGIAFLGHDLLIVDMSALAKG